MDATRTNIMRTSPAGRGAIAALLAGLLLLFAVPAGAVRGLATDMPDLEISIAVPLRGKVRSIFVTNQQPHFHVVLRNSGRAPRLLWTQDCSWGHGALQFETVDAGGNIKKIVRPPAQFLTNRPTTYELAPGDVKVFDIYFASDEWRTFVLPAKGKILSTRLRAVYEVAEDDAAKEHGAWTGKIASPLETYRFEDRR